MFYGNEDSKSMF